MKGLLEFIALCTVSLRPNEDGTWRLPRNELGEDCEWPFEPVLLSGAPMGQYHCGYCGGMQIAGIPHMDWSPEDDAAFDAAMEAGEGSWAQPPEDDVFS